MMEIGAAIIVLVLIVFIFVIFPRITGVSGLEKAVGLVVTCFIIVVGGCIVMALMATSPMLMFMGIMCVVIFVGAFIGETSWFKNGQTMRGVDSHEISAASSDVILARLSNIEKGQVISFGRYNWRVLAVENGCAYLLADQIVAVKPFGKYSQKDRTSWEGCGLRKYLNGAFYDSSFSQEEKKLIQESVVQNWRARYGYFSEKPTPLPDTRDKIFVPSEKELSLYMPDFKSRVLKINGKLVCWWIRDTCAGGIDDANCVESSGGVGSKISFADDCGVRPAMWIRVR